MSCQTSTSTSTDKETGPDGELKPMTKVKPVRRLFSLRALRAAQRLTPSFMTAKAQQTSRLVDSARNNCSRFHQTNVDEEKILKKD